MKLKNILNILSTTLWMLFNASSYLKKTEALQSPQSSPLTREFIPSRLINMLSVRSELVKSSAITYKSGRTFLAASNIY